MSGNSSFLNGRIQDEEKSVRVSRSSDPVLDDDADVAGHTIYRTKTALDVPNAQLDERPQVICYSV